MISSSTVSCAPQHRRSQPTTLSPSVAPRRRGKSLEVSADLPDGAFSASRLVCKQVMKSAGRVARQHPWLLATALGSLLFLSLRPILLKAPAAGVSSLLDQLERDSSSTLSKEVAAQTLRLLFASQPWSRPQIGQRASSLPFTSLLHSDSPKLVEQAACLLADVRAWNHTALPEGLDLASLLPRKACAAACQKCIISGLGHPSAPLGQSFSPAAQHVLLQWAGLQPLEDLAALRMLTHQASTTAAALLVNQAASPAGRAAILATPGLVRDLQSALQLSAAPRHAISAARAARLLGNLAQEQRFVASLQASHDLEPLLKVGPVLVW